MAAQGLCKAVSSVASPPDWCLFPFGSLEGRKTVRCAYFLRGPYLRDLVIRLSPCGSVSDGTFQVADDSRVEFAFVGSSVGRSGRGRCNDGSVECMPDCLAPGTQLMRAASGNGCSRNVVDFDAVLRI